MKLEVSNALAHPLRVSMLDLMKTEATSAQSLAGRLGAGLSNVTYHLTVLRSAGLVEEVGTDPAKGPAERLYRGA